MNQKIENENNIMDQQIENEDNSMNEQNNNEARKAKILKYE